MAKRIIITDEDLTGDEIVFTTRRQLPMVITGLSAGMWYLLNTTMSEAISVGQVAEPASFARAPLTITSRSVHSGHSLTDTYVHTGAYPAHIRSIADDVFPGIEWDRIAKSTIPGSPMRYRWDHPSDSPDARLDVDLFDALMITEAGPPFRIGYRSEEIGRNETLESLMRFTLNQIDNGAGNEVILWSIWPNMHGWTDEGLYDYPQWAELGGFRNCLPEYGRSFKLMADYATWKAKQERPDLPADWRVWLIPGHAWMARFYDDLHQGLVPGISDFGDVWAAGDPVGGEIHPNNTLGYGMACFVFTCLYQIDLRTQEDLYVPEAYTDYGGDHPAVTQEQAEYFWRIAWELATTYETVGMGGTEGAALEFVGGVDADPLAEEGTGPNPEPGDLPEALIKWTSASYEGPEFIGTMPEVEGQELIFTGSELRVEHPMTGFYLAARLRIEKRDNSQFLLAILTDGYDLWANPSAAANLNLWFGDSPNLFVQAPSNQSGVDTGNRSYDDFVIIEAWAFGDEVGVKYDDLDDRTMVTPAPVPSTTHLRVMTCDSDTAEIDVSATHYLLMERMPTGDERASITSWMQSRSGPLREPTPRLTPGVVLGGHSSLQPANYDNILRDAVGSVMTAGDRQSSQDVWNGKAALAGAAGGLVRWFMAERRRIREGCISVASGAMMAHFGTPLMLALLEKWFGEFRGDVGNTAAFCAGSVTSSAAPITMRRANDGHQLPTMMPLSGGDEKICQ